MSDIILLEEQGGLPEFAPEPPVELGKEEARGRFNRIGFAFLAMVALQQGGGVALTVLIGRFPALAGNTVLPVLAVFLPLYLLALPAFLLIMRGQRPMPYAGEKRRIPGAMVAQSAFVGYLSMLLFNLVVVLGLYALIGRLKGSEAVNPLAAMVAGGNPLIVLPFLVLGAPLLEEYVFRGVLLKHLGAFGAKPYILFSSLVFALFHANLAQIPYAFVIGLILASLTYYSGTIKYAVITHLIINFMGSGVPSLLLRMGETGALAVGVMAIVCACIGVVSAILLLRNIKRKQLAFEPATALLPKDVMVRNAGVILFIFVMAALTGFVLML